MIINKINIINFIEYYKDYLTSILLDKKDSSLFSEGFKFLLTEINNILKFKNSNYPLSIDALKNDLESLAPILLKDVEAFYKNDPASFDRYEIINVYLSFLAVLTYRISHALIKYNIPYISRYISELAHFLTGIDINPHAMIGESFFIDHGTGIIIGETTIIGNNVKIYQGVTLGASSLKKGRLLKNQKRHPTILNNVTIYANAMVLGGDTIIEDDCIIGANVIVNKSLKQGSVISLKNSYVIKRIQ